MSDLRARLLPDRLGSWLAWAASLVCALALIGAILALGGAGPAAASGGAAPVAPGSTMHQRFAVGEVVMSFTDRHRRIRLPNGRFIPRHIVTVIRYPALGPPSHVSVKGAPPAKGQGRFPLVVFGHGFAVTPEIYARLLHAWAAAGYVVAAPIFPLSNRNAPGAPDEADLVNQPTDMSFVITRILIANAATKGILAGLINAHEIAVSGQSDGGSTALATAYDSHFTDRRVGAAVILSGARIPGLSGYFTRKGSPLLAVQGTTDQVNFPSSTYKYYGLARPPKFLLLLLGASHLAPYTTEQPQLGIVERASIAFFDRYLKHEAGARLRMARAGKVPGVATLK